MFNFPSSCYKQAFAFTSLTAALLSGNVLADWQDTVKQAKDQTVYFNAWGGAENINDYIKWLGDRVQDEYGVTVKHVKLVDTANAVSRVVAEKSAGNDTHGSIDLVWINGENFSAMKRNDLLFGPFSQTLPNYRYVNEAARQSLTQDFGEPVDGMESPWGMAQVIFMHDTATLQSPPKSMAALLKYAQANPGRVTYPEPPQFLGTTFLKQALIELADDPSQLAKPVDQADFAKVTQPLWQYLDQLHPVAWRSGSTFPASSEAMIRLLDDQEIDIALSFDVSSASVQINKGNLPDTVRSYVFDKGTIGNTHFVAIPYNASASAGAQVLANFMLSPEAQIRKQTATIWGDMTVLSYDRLNKADQAQFDALPKGVATLNLDELGTTLAEPHTSWVSALETAWRSRYAK